MFDSGRKEGREGGRKEENFFHDYVYLGDGEFNIDNLSLGKI